MSVKDIFISNELKEFKMNTSRANRNASRDLYNSTTEAVLSLPPLHARNHNLRPEGFTYGKPSLVYNTSPYEKKPADRALNGAFAWKAHEMSKASELAQDFTKLNVMSVRNSIILPKEVREFRNNHADIRLSPSPSPSFNKFATLNLDRSDTTFGKPYHNDTSVKDLMSNNFGQESARQALLLRSIDTEIKKLSKVNLKRSQPRMTKA